ncbi:peroxiredoxin [Hyphomicrobium sp. LHD-15]|uniref:peroxiredoxin n=1 Tax=Hyphomicrobium sp. LHD-15 TaxID=3072142 RepID=UPI00280FBF47|nr:peroxiredoxin [Hyphomicrobium sp. LHD-15]MDQ8697900.1 peroxiredoxin [Hyphomicrobium sp. LHD-15]
MTAWPYPAPGDDGEARHLATGLSLPDIARSATSGSPVNLANLAGRWVVFVYPWTGRPGLANPPGWDDIPGAHGSTPEAEGFRDHYETFRAAGFDVLGISGQTTADQQEFANRMRLPFPLLSDADGRLREALRLPAFETGGVVYLKRLTFVLRDGAIERVVYPVHPPHTHAADLLATLHAR